MVTTDFLGAKFGRREPAFIVIPGPWFSMTTAVGAARGPASIALPSEDNPLVRTLELDVLRAENARLRQALGEGPQLLEEPLGMPAGFGKCPHCDVGFLLEVLGQHQTCCDLRPRPVTTVVQHDVELAKTGKCQCPWCVGIG